MTFTCLECGAGLTDGSCCKDHFHAMLLVESEFVADSTQSSDGHGEIAHFYAVSSYILQHPVSMNYTAKAIAGLRKCVEDHLIGRATLQELRHRVRRTASGAARITRRTGDMAEKSVVPSWPVTVKDIIAGGVKGYGLRVAAWAESIIVTLDAIEAEQSGKPEPPITRSLRSSLLDSGSVTTDVTRRRTSTTRG